MKIRTFLMLTALLIASSYLFAQENTPANAALRKNTLKLNVTPLLNYSMKNWGISYERVLNDHRSFSFDVTYFELPTVGLYDSLNITHDTKRGGFGVAADYRFFLKKRGTGMPPKGWYLAPFASYHYTSFGNDFTLNGQHLSGNFHTDGNLNVFTASAEVGYQFLINDWFTIDLILIGPTFNVYSAKMHLSGDNIDVDTESEYLQAIFDILSAKYEFFDGLLKKGQVNETGTVVNMGYGMRYMVQFGIRF